MEHVSQVSSLCFSGKRRERDKRTVAPLQEYTQQQMLSGEKKLHNKEEKYRQRTLSCYLTNFTFIVGVNTSLLLWGGRKERIK